MAMSPLPDSIGKCPRQRIRYGDQHWAQDQCRARSNLVKDQKLRDKISKNRHRHQVAGGCECASQQFPAMFSVKNECPKERRKTRTSIFYSTPDAQSDGYDWLKDKSHPSGPRETSENVVKELACEQIQVTSAYDPHNRAWQCSYEHHNHNSA